MTSITEFEIVSIIILSAITCSIPGTFLILRNNYYAADTISRSSILGIAFAFGFVNYLASPFVILGGVVSAVMGMMLVRAIKNITGFRGKGISIIVYSFILSLGLLYGISISDSSNFDISSIYLGETAFAFFDRVRIAGVDIGSYSAYAISTAAIINLILIIIFYKEIKADGLDKSYALSIGLKINKVDLLVLIMTSLSMSVSFQTAGVFMTTAFILGPASIAHFYTKSLTSMAAASIFICFISCLIGFTIAWQEEVSIAGTITSFIGLFFIVTVFFAPLDGIVHRFFDKLVKKKKLEECIVLDIIADCKESFDKSNFNKSVAEALGWKEAKVTYIINKLIAEKKMEFVDNIPLVLYDGRKDIEKILAKS